MRPDSAAVSLRSAAAQAPKPQLELNFIEFVVLPLWKTVARAFPVFEARVAQMLQVVMPLPISPLSSLLSPLSSPLIPPLIPSHPSSHLTPPLLSHLLPSPLLQNHERWGVLQRQAAVPAPAPAPMSAPPSAAAVPAPAAAKPATAPSADAKAAAATFGEKAEALSAAAAPAAPAATATAANDVVVEVDAIPKG